MVSGVLLAGALAFLWRAMRPELPRLRESFRELSWGVLAAVVALELATHAISAWLFRIALVGSPADEPGAPSQPGLRAIFGISSVGNLGKYLPGRLWPLLWQGFQLRRWNVPAGQTALAIAVCTAYALMGALMVGGAAAALSPIPAPLRLGAALAALLAAALSAIGPGPLLRLPGIPEGTRRSLTRLGPGASRTLGSGFAALWALHCLGGALLTSRLAPALGAGGHFQVAGAICFAWIVGAAAILAPGGLGVREASLIVALASLPDSLKVQIPVYMRLTGLAGELLAAALGLLLLGAAREPVTEPGNGSRTSSPSPGTD